MILRNVPDSYVFANFSLLLQITRGLTRYVEMYHTPTRGGSEQEQPNPYPEE
jgi:hypothetical protein